MEQELQQKIDLKTKPPGSLGVLESIAKKTGSIQQTLTPTLNNPCMLVFAGDHGIVDEGVSPFPKEVTFQMVMNFLNGGAAINVFCRQHNINLQVVDAGVDHDFPENAKGLIHAKIAKGTRNFLKEAAMTNELCEQAIQKGREIVAQKYNEKCNIIGFGEMGIGNTSAASLIMHKCTGKPIKECTGRGTGHDDNGLDKKTAILAKASEQHNVQYPMDILATYGGFEIAMMAGGMLEAAEKGMVIMVDGFIATSALLIAYQMDVKVPDHCIFCHQSDEAGHKAMLEYLSAEPVLKLGMRLGEGTGAAVAFPIIQSAVNFLNEMASFDDAGVSNKENKNEMDSGCGCCCGTC